MSDRFTAAVTRELERLQAKHRCWSSISCDRCHTSLSLTSSTEMALDTHLLCTALALRWALCPATVAGLGGQPQTDATDRDLCPACRSLSDAVPRNSR